MKVNHKSNRLGEHSIRTARVAVEVQTWCNPKICIFLISQIYDKLYLLNII